MPDIELDPKPRDVSVAGSSAGSVPAEGGGAQCEDRSSAGREGEEETWEGKESCRLEVDVPEMELSYKLNPRDVSDAGSSAGSVPAEGVGRGARMREGSERREGRAGAYPRGQWDGYLC